MGCSESSVNNWERNRAHPKVRQLPSIITFLGYVPIDPGESWSGRLARARRAMGWSRRRLARLLGVDESTVKRWEDGRRRRSARLREQLNAILGQAAP